MNSVLSNFKNINIVFSLDCLFIPIKNQGFLLGV
ncbi:hypothetical protein P872_19560 [Rhodonellum psychrophilum GCM71 = DSM 17998]|uniref:Uncharacterized protein n=1 Tax=Rhodonellum psychrophilum GCM71 = DSM 17998 TaxID=1123057 RepID=U5BYH1_9BACT|nr:hypothetical protein P872_19560 [Rhodonellum psychrophilum GCM71 = DSM 17998]